MEAIPDRVISVGVTVDTRPLRATLKCNGMFVQWSVNNPHRDANVTKNAGSVPSAVKMDDASCRELS